MLRVREILEQLAVLFITPINAIIIPVTVVTHVIGIFSVFINIIKASTSLTLI